jgi:hypothetical protein
VYLSNGLVKLQIALAKGKKLYDKRQDIAKKDLKREAQRDFKVNMRAYSLDYISWASNGFDGDHAAGEASRMQCVKWQT